VGAWTLRDDPLGHYACLGVGLLMILVGMSFMHLTVQDEQDALAVRFGPLPLFFTRIPYDQISAVARDRTTVLDGWGLHYFPGRGTTYNLWGFDCVRVDVGKRTGRIGTDDAEALTAFLRKRLPIEPTPLA
jgi:hypothetical protein